MGKKSLLASLGLVALGLVLVFIIAQGVNNNQNGSGAIKASATPLGSRTKTADCKVNGPYQDLACSPGQALVGVTKDQVCKSGYASSVRNVSESLKNLVYTEYGITSHQTGEYEVDHIVSLELGGSNDIANLYPEAASPKPGFHEKDKIENYLHDQVCSGNISLEDAQKIVAHDWVNVYKQLYP